MTKPKILIIEDESLVAMELQCSVISWGYECPFIAVKGEEAVEWALQNSPDMILAEVFQKNGRDNISSLAEIKNVLDVPVIFFSAYIDEKLVERTLETRPHCFLLKPFDNQELRINVDLALKSLRD
ncbi:MAG TPA: response regulator [Methanobacteriaceae archaeon]|nr:response regulator [Methanobacteriaceae archaeon]